MTTSNGGANAPGAGGGNAPAGGSQGAGNPEQTTQLLETLLGSQKYQDSLTGAVRAHVARAIEGAVPGLLAPMQQQLAALAEKFSAGAGGASKEPGSSDKNARGANPELEELRSKFEASEKRATEAEKRLHRERKSAALSDVLAKVGCRDPRLAIRDLIDRGDIVAKDDGQGGVTWVGKIHDQYGTPVEAGIDKVVGKYLEEHPVLAPPVGGVGSGAQGGRASSHGIDLSKLTAEQYRALPKETQDALFSAASGIKPSGGVFG